MIETAKLNDLKQHGLIAPNYANGSIANLPATISQLLNVPFTGLSPIADQQFTPSLEGAKRVVLLIIDGFGKNLYEQSDQSLYAFEHAEKATTTLSSIFPSTTVAALSSIWTGVAPARHGMLGLKLFFPEFATAGQMISFTPTFKKLPDALVDAGLEPKAFLQYQGFCEQLTQQGVSSHIFKGKEIVNSALSYMHGRGATEEIGVATFAEMLTQMRSLIASKLNEKLFISGYWPTIDTLSHAHGWSHETVTAELEALFFQIKHSFINKMSAAEREGTVLLIVADHGQTVCPAEKHIFLADHPDLEKMLFMQPTGEPRVVYLHTKHGCETAVIQYINTHLSHAFLPLSGKDALAMGLFGPPPFVDEAEQRVGDVVVIGKDQYTLFTGADQEEANKFYGRHGSLTSDEMLVPLLGYRLG